MTHQTALGTTRRPTPAEHRNRWPHWWVAAVPAVAMLGVGLWGLDRGSMWQDESASFEVSQRTVVQILAMARNVDVVHAAYYVALHVWMLPVSMVPGGGEVWMRVPSVLAAAVAAGTVGALGLHLAGARTGLVAGLLSAATPLASHYAQEGRSFSIVAALVLLATYCLVRATETPDATLWWRAGYLSAAVVATLLHEFAVLALAAHGVTLLISGLLRRIWRWWAISAAIVVFAVLPLAYLSQRQSAQIGWLRRPTGSTLVTLAHQFVGSGAVALGIVALLIVVGVAGLRLGTGRIDLPSLGLPLAVVPPAILLLVSLAYPLYHVRYVLFSLAGISLLAATGLSRLVRLVPASTGGRRVAWLVSIVLVVVIFAAQLPAQRFERTIPAHGNDLAGAAEIIRREARPGDSVLFLPRRFRAAALGYPQSFTKVHDVTLDKSPIQADNLRGTDLGRRQVRAALLATTRVWVVSRPGMALGSTEIGGISARQVLRAYFVSEASYRMAGMEVALNVRMGSPG